MSINKGFECYRFLRNFLSPFELPNASLMSLGVNVRSLSHLTGCAHGLLYFSTSWSPSDEHPWTSNNTQATTKTAKKPRTVITFLSSSQAVKRFLQFWRYGGRLNIKAHCRVYQQKYSVSLKITFLHERSVSGSKLWPGIRVRSAHNQHARYC